MMRQTLIVRVFAWFSGWTQVSITALLLLSICSGLGVIYSVHLTRHQYSELQELQAAQDYLDSEYERLLLEQSAWADYARIDQVSREELAMKVPEANDLVVLRR